MDSFHFASGILAALSLVTVVTAGYESDGYDMFTDDIVDNEEYLDYPRLLTTNDTNTTGYCVPDYCENGAECESGESTYSCDCLDGYSGQNCTDEVQIDGIQVKTTVSCDLTVELADDETPQDFVDKEEYQEITRISIAETLDVDEADVYIMSIEAVVASMRLLSRRTLGGTTSFTAVTESEVKVDSIEDGNELIAVVSSDEFATSFTEAFTETASTYESDDFPSIVVEGVTVSDVEIDSTGVDCNDFGPYSHATCDVCIESECLLLECSGDYLNSDGDISTGCEYHKCVYSTGEAGECTEYATGLCRTTADVTVITNASGSAPSCPTKVYADCECPGSSNNDDDDSDDTGAIVGGVVGGVAGLALLSFAAYWCFSKANAKK